MLGGTYLAGALQHGIASNEIPLFRQLEQTAQWRAYSSLDFGKLGERHEAGEVIGFDLADNVVVVGQHVGKLEGISNPEIQGDYRRIFGKQRLHPDRRTLGEVGIDLGINLIQCRAESGNLLFNAHQIPGGIRTT